MKRQEHMAAVLAELRGIMSEHFFAPDPGTAPLPAPPDIEDVDLRCEAPGDAGPCGYIFVIDDPVIKREFAELWYCPLCGGRNSMREGVDYFVPED